MKRLIISVMVALCLAILGMICMSAQSTYKSEVRKECKVDDFTAIEMNTVGNILFTQSDNYSLRIEGSENVVDAMQYKVEGNCLKISRKKLTGDNNHGAILYISAPDLKKLHLNGVGRFLCKTPLRVKDIELKFNGVGKNKITDLTCRRARIEVDGVGDVDIHINCEELKADLDGVGSATISGSAKRSEIHNDGVRRCNIKNLAVEQ